MRGQTPINKFHGENRGFSQSKQFPAKKPLPPINVFFFFFAYTVMILEWTMGNNFRLKNQMPISGNPIQEAPYLFFSFATLRPSNVNFQFDLPINPIECRYDVITLQTIFDNVWFFFSRQISVFFWFRKLELVKFFGQKFSNLVIFISFLSLHAVYFPFSQILFRKNVIVLC